MDPTARMPSKIPPPAGAKRASRAGSSSTGDRKRRKRSGERAQTTTAVHAQLPTDGDGAGGVKEEETDEGLAGGASSTAVRFPATISFEDAFAGGVGRGIATPRDWHTAAGAHAAAERRAHACRLLGFSRLTLSLPALVTRGEGGGEEDVMRALDALAGPVRASRRTVRRNYRGPAGVETWNDVGEPGHGGGLIPVGKLAAAAVAGDVVIREDHGLRLLQALASAAHPVTSPWRVPLLRCVCVNDPRPIVTTGEPDEGAVELTLACYASRLMFELIACDEIKFIMAHLVPSAPVRHPLSVRPVHPRAFYTDAAQAGGADDARFCFTLPGLLAAAVSDGYPEASQPPGLTLPLMDFQKQTLRWMQDQEASPRGLNGTFWEERRWADAVSTGRDGDEPGGAAKEEAEGREGKGGDVVADGGGRSESGGRSGTTSWSSGEATTKEDEEEEDAGGSYWYFPLAGELRLTEPPLSRGGMLSEEMGLGKTLEILALISADKEPAAASTASRAEVASVKNEKDEEDEQASPAAVPPECTKEVDERVRAGATATGTTPSRATLIVVPPPLLRQWEAEVAKSVAPGSLRVRVHAGRSKGPRGASDEDRARELAAADVVLATYPQLQKEAAGAAGGASRSGGGSRVLSRVRWRRVVLDECQMVRSSTTQLAKACRCLTADFRWMVSGTPLHAGVDDLNGELAFLGVWPFCLSDQTDGFWAHRVGRPWAAQQEEALPLLHALLRGVVVRHTKAQRRVRDDTPLLTLPPAGREWRAVTHGPLPVEAPSERFVCAFLEHHAAAAARGALDTLQGEASSSVASSIPGGGGTGRAAASARQLAGRLLRLVRGATTSATLVRSRLRDVDAALRAAATSAHPGSNRRADTGGVLSGAQIAADAAVGRVRALPVAQALVELMAPREANDARRTAQGSARGGTAAASAWQLRNADMHSFEAARQAWRGTSRQYADAGGSDLAHKIASVAGNVVRVVRAALERRPALALHPGVAELAAEHTAAAEVKTALATVNAALHRLEHAFPGPLADLCACATWTPCACGTAWTRQDRDKDAACCERLAAFRELRRADNRTGRVKEAVAVAKAVDEMASDAMAAARVPLPRLRWLLAVECITSGAAFDLFPRVSAGGPSASASVALDRAPARLDPSAEEDPVARGAIESSPLVSMSPRGIDDDDGAHFFDRRRLGVRFVRRALLRAVLAASVAAAERKIERARAAAQARDSITGKATRAIRDAPDELREALEAARGEKRAAEAAFREGAPGGCRPARGALLAALPGAVHAASAAVLAALRDAVDAHGQHSARVAREVGSLLPYLRCLAAAGSEGMDRMSDDHSTVQQSGFELLNEVLKGNSPQCCICCAPASDPCIARCMHLACTRCMVTWYHAAPLHGPTGAGSSAAAPPCPLCRKPFTLDELIRLLPPAPRLADGDHVSVAPGHGVASGDGDKDGRSEAGRESEDAGTTKDAARARFTPAAAPADFLHLPLPAAEERSLMSYRDGRYPALSMDGGRFLAHLHRAALRRSPKINALVADLREALNAPGAAGKAVVFSQLRDALAHAHQQLTWEGIGAETVGVRSSGTHGSEHEGAIERFRTDPDVKVLLLHAGTAAAGLTLTQADLVILLEPFLSPGDEAQAANRVHRIGQARTVRCVTYFVRDTVEERLLAYRRRQTAFGGGEGVDGGGGGGDKADELSVMSDGASAFGASLSHGALERMRFIFGISDSFSGLTRGSGDTDEEVDAQQPTVVE